MSQFFASGGQSIRVSASASLLPMNTQGLISFKMDWLDLFAVQGIFKSLLQHHSSNASILQRSAFFTAQLSHPYMTTMILEPPQVKSDTFSTVSPSIFYEEMGPDAMILVF